MTPTLYPDQMETANELRDALPAHRHVLLQAAAGSGKTQIASYVTDQAFLKKKRVVFTCHRAELITQTSATFSRWNVPHSFVASKLPYVDMPIRIASIDTLKNRIKRSPEQCYADILIIDETHLAMAKGWKRVADWYKEQGAFTIGLTATPERLDGKGLGDIYNHMIHAPSIKWLIDNGRLSGYDMYAPVGLDEKLRSKGKDYDPDQGAQAASALVGDALSHWKKLAEGMLTVGYAFNRSHSQEIVDKFNRNGVPAAHIDGYMDPVQRKMIIRKFANRELMYISNVNLVSEGFDLGAQVGMDITVEACQLNSRTKSLARYIQRAMRCMRKKDFNAVLMDHANNFEIHGFPDDDREWTLEGRAKKSSGTAEAPVKVCDTCFLTVPAGARVCPGCGSEFSAQSREIKQAAGQLTKLEKDAQRKAAAQTRRYEESQATSLEDLRELARKRGYKPGWAERRFRDRMKKTRRR